MISYDTVVNTNLVFLHQTGLRSRLIYSITLLGIVFTLGSLPFIYTTISIKSIGLIQSAGGKTELLAPIGGRLLYVNLADNQSVTKGSTLLIIDDALLQQQKKFLSNEFVQLKEQLIDAQELIIEISKQLRSENYMPKTKLYTASFQHYVEQFQNVTNAKQQAERIYLRYLSLYHKNVVTLSEFELCKFNFEQALSVQQELRKKYLKQWQIEVNHHQNKLRELQIRETELSEQIKQYSLKATLNGSIQNLTGLQKGSYVYANQKLAEISPDNALFAYSYVKPSDIGLLKTGMSVRIEMDAFNYNQWGLLAGKIVDISDDSILQNQVPYFKIKCSLDKNYLQLKNGYKGYIKKGMTLRANFTLAKRSLYQLLYDNVTNWISLK